MRLNKYLADCGVASRRACDKLIAEGRVAVNGKIVDQMGVVVNPDNDHVTVNGKRVAVKHKTYYILLHKPKGYVTTVCDELGRRTVMDLIDIKARLYPVGRLDYDTEGALILTNDGDVANKLTHPKNQVSKVYVCRISGEITNAEVAKLEKGVEIDGKLTLPAGVKVLESDVHHSRVELTIREGRNRQVRRMFEAIGKDVEFLKRVAVGEIRLGGLSRGKYRFLNEKEIAYLKSLK